MGNDLILWRFSISVFKCRCFLYKKTTKVKICTGHFSFMLSLLKMLLGCISIIIDGFSNVFFYLLMLLLLLNYGDIERNPGPVNNFNYTDLSILHCNIRSLRHKLEHIRDSYLDYDILCFTEIHLDMTVPDEFLHLSNSLDKLDRKDHGGGICVYLSSSLLHQRVMELETFCEESIWISITFKRRKVLIGTFYSPKISDSLFFEKFNKNIEKAYEITHNIVILGDLNEDLFNPNFRKLKYILNINSLQNVISEPTRLNTLLDPILVPNAILRFWDTTEST